jgi:hypothetical protein
MSPERLISAEKETLIKKTYMRESAEAIPQAVPRTEITVCQHDLRESRATAYLESQKSLVSSHTKQPTWPIKSALAFVIIT